MLLSGIPVPPSTELEAELTEIVHKAIEAIDYEIEPLSNIYDQKAFIQRDWSLIAGNAVSVVFFTTPSMDNPCIFNLGYVLLLVNTVLS